MNKIINKDLTLQANPTPMIDSKTRRTFQVRRFKDRRKQNSRVIVSCQDIRDLASTLYLNEIPGLCGLEGDRDILIDQYYVPGSITD